MNQETFLKLYFYVSLTGCQVSSLSNVPSTHESQTLPTDTGHAHSLLLQATAHAACYHGAFAPTHSKRDKQRMSWIKCLERGCQRATGVQTAWQLLTEQGQMNGSLQLGRMSEWKANWGWSPDGLAATLPEREWMNRRRRDNKTMRSNHILTSCWAYSLHTSGMMNQGIQI